jgi:hypothetical protein
LCRNRKEKKKEKKAEHTKGCSFFLFFFSPLVLTVVGLFSSSRSGKKKDADSKKAESSAQFARHDYLLELTCANKQYLKFRNDQFPEVMDVSLAMQQNNKSSNEAACLLATGSRHLNILSFPFFSFFFSFLFLFFPPIDTCCPISTSKPTQQTVNVDGTDHIKTFFQGYAQALLEAGDSKNLEKLRKLSMLLTPEFERRSFLHENRHEFPGRQLFDMEPYQVNIRGNKNKKKTKQNTKAKTKTKKHKTKKKNKKQKNRLKWNSDL